MENDSLKKERRNHKRIVISGKDNVGMGDMIEENRETGKT